MSFLGDNIMAANLGPDLNGVKQPLQPSSVGRAMGSDATYAPRSVAGEVPLMTTPDELEQIVPRNFTGTGILMPPSDPDPDRSTLVPKRNLEGRESYITAVDELTPPNKKIRNNTKDIKLLEIANQMGDPRSTMSWRGVQKSL